jgi:hypothetical protein
MLALLWSVIRDTFAKFFCKSCKKKSMFAVEMVRHLHREHGQKLTKKDVKFLLRYNLLTRMLLSLVAIVLFIPLLVLKLVLLPLHYLYELL